MDRTYFSDGGAVLEDQSFAESSIFILCKGNVRYSPFLGRRTFFSFFNLEEILG
jgi:hypothetical protein